MSARSQRLDEAETSRRRGARGPSPGAVGRAASPVRVLLPRAADPSALHERWRTVSPSRRSPTGRAGSDTARGRSRAGAHLLLRRRATRRVGLAPDARVLLDVLAQPDPA